MRSQGVEAEVNGRIAPGWNLSVGYAYTQTKTLEGTPDEKAQLYTFIAPRHNFLNLWTRYQFGAGSRRLQRGCRPAQHQPHVPPQR